MKRVVAGLCACLLLTACGSEDAEAPLKEQVAEAVTSSSPTFSPKDVAPIKVADITKPEIDPGLNIKVDILGTGSNPMASGSVIYLLVTNLNDVALPPEALKVFLDGASPVQEGSTPLDLPLGPGASVNIDLAFDASYGSLYQGRLTVGNLVFEGNLNNA
ncbi:MAG: hypothetical protein Q4A31_08885 [Corynebacterium sp.]|uniref:hypothetical protein n=1 Tax=Corynebacterium sp. TaxID=1720 RepID=UPI0026DB4608|nr:hypothetical protein [Corynebacterium sp.]MDO4762018.1 hypothetical protein [Corynebacterium sp.]